MTVKDLTVDELTEALERSWCAETSNDPAGWSPSRPAHGQCAVTALMVQHFFGGELLRAEVEGVSHYWNRLEDAREIDLTRSQFDSFDPLNVAVRDRDYVLSFPETVKRYRLLWALVAERLGSRHGEHG